MRFALFIAIFGSASWGLAVQQEGHSYDRVHLNWSTMRIAYYGIASSEEALKDSEELAIKEGISYIVEALPGIRAANLGAVHSGDKADHQKASHGVAKNSALVGTTYYANGKVKVQLESSLPKALAPQGLTFLRSEPIHEDNGQDGLIISLNEVMDPQIIFEIHDENGGILFQSHDVAQSEFHKNFMGRFYTKAASRQSRFYVGKNPVKIKGSLKGDRIIVVKAKEWSEKVAKKPGILERAKIAIITK